MSLLQRRHSGSIQRAPGSVVSTLMSGQLARTSCFLNGAWNSNSNRALAALRRYAYPRWSTAEKQTSSTSKTERVFPFQPLEGQAEHCIDPLHEGGGFRQAFPCPRWSLDDRPPGLVNKGNP